MAGEAKVFRDPIYGYISVRSDFVTKFIDTPCFQRLRHIKQTSYSSVYMTSTHNRFSHSLGVYHLGEIVYKHIITFMKKNEERFVFKNNELNDSLFEWLDNHEDLFLAACLLHDVGHAPFSHTGEEFYGSKIEEFEESLYNAIARNSDVVDKFKIDKEKGESNAKAHEYMSVLIALKTFNEYFENKPEEDRDLFARCITGYKYSPNATTITDGITKEDEEEYYRIQIKNCIIELLNSNVIDVDKLDYIIRDDFMSGYQNVTIDYNRLLGGLVIVKDEDKIFLAYHKNAMSIIENVIYASDNEKKWIHAQPVIRYEEFLLKHYIKKVRAFFDSENRLTYPFFSINSLSVKGNEFSPDLENKSNLNVNISLLSDIDILFFIKNVKECQDSLTDEYFNRNLRRHPIWKSEEEYLHIINNAISDPIETKKFSDKLYRVVRDIARVIDLLIIEKKINLPIIKEKTLEIIDEEYKNRSIEERILFEICKIYVEILKGFSYNKGIDFDFVVIPEEGFKSNFSKIDIKNLKIWYPHDEKPIGEFNSVLTADRNDLKYFYLYYKRKDNVKSKETFSKTEVSKESNDEKIKISDISKLFKDLTEKYDIFHSND